MAKFTFKDTGEQIKVGDVFYYIGYENTYSKGTPSITKIVKSCTVQTISNFYILKMTIEIEHQFLITDDISNPTFVINDCLYSSQEACNNAMEVSESQKSISQDIFAVHDINIIKEIHNKYFNNKIRKLQEVISAIHDINIIIKIYNKYFNNKIRKLQEVISRDIFAIHDIDKLKEIHNKIFNNINL